MAEKTVASKQITIVKLSDGYTLYTAPSTISIPSNNDGTAPVLTNAKFRVILMQGNALVPVVLGTITGDGCTATKSDDIVTISSLVAGRTSGTITVQVTTTVDPEYDGVVTVNFVLAKAGEAGNNGKDAYTVILSNESSALPADGNGNVAAGDYNLTQCSVQVYSGATLLTAVAATTTPTIGKFRYVIKSTTGGTSARVDNTSFKLTALNSNANNAVINIEVNCENVGVFQKQVNITKVTLIDVSQLEYIKQNLFSFVEGGLVSSSVIAVSPNALDAQTTPGLVNAGMSGVDSGNGAVRFWAGNPFGTRGSAPFRVTEDGSLYATKAVITGDITATKLYIQSGADTNVATKDDVDNLQFGAVNLLRNTSRFTSINFWTTQNATNFPITIDSNQNLVFTYAAGTSTHAFNRTTKSIVAGTYYTLTVTMKSSIANSIGNLFNFSDHDGVSYPQGFGTATFNAADTFQNFVFTIKSTVNGALAIALTTTVWATGQVITIKQIQLEEGNKSSSYAIAPEDNQANIDRSTILGIRDAIKAQFDSILSANGELSKKMTFYSNTSNIGVYFSQEIYDTWIIAYNRLSSSTGDYLVYVNDYYTISQKYNNLDTYTLAQAQADQATLNVEYLGGDLGGASSGALYELGLLITATQKADRDSEQWRLNQVKIGGENLISNLPINWTPGALAYATGAEGTTGTTYVHQKGLIITPNTEITVTMFYDGGDSSVAGAGILEYKSDGTWIKTPNAGTLRDRVPYTFTTNTNTGILGFNLNYVPTGTPAITPNDVGNKFKIKVEIGNKGTDFSYSWTDSQWQVNNLEIGAVNQVTGITSYWQRGSTTTDALGATLANTTDDTRITLSLAIPHETYKSNEIVLKKGDNVISWVTTSGTTVTSTITDYVEVELMLFTGDTAKTFVKSINLGVIKGGKKFTSDGIYYAAINLHMTLSGQKMMQLVTPPSGGTQINVPIIGIVANLQLCVGNVPSQSYLPTYEDLAIESVMIQYQNQYNSILSGLSTNPGLTKYQDPSSVLAGLISQAAFDLVAPALTAAITALGSVNDYLTSVWNSGQYVMLKGYNASNDIYNLTWEVAGQLSSKYSDVVTAIGNLYTAIDAAEDTNLNWRQTIAKKNLLNWDKLKLSATPNDVVAIQDFAQFYNTSTTYSDTTIELLENPYGKLAPVWRSVTKAVPSTGNAWSGGFFVNLPYKEPLLIDYTKAYRVVVFVRDVSGTGNIYIGFSTHSISSTGGPVNTNPYFLSFSKSVPARQRWLMVVGYIAPLGATSSQLKNNELYDCTTGLQITSGVTYLDSQFQWQTNAATSSDLFLRVSQYSSSSNAVGAETQFFAPRFEVMDGTEPSIAQLLDLGRVANLSFNDFIGGVFQDTQNAVAVLQDQADNRIDAWDGSGTPTLNNFPASDWVATPITDPDSYRNHAGDTYYDVDAGIAYRFTASGSGPSASFSWVVIGSSAVTQALAQAAKAQQTADGKMSIFTGATVPTKNLYRLGDLWIREITTNTPHTYEPWTCISETNPQPTTAVAGDLAQWTKASDWTNDDYAHLVNDKVDITVIDSTTKRYNNPDGAQGNYNGQVTGYVVITTPITPTSSNGYMCSLDIEGFIYTGTGATNPSQIDLTVSFYAYWGKVFYSENFINRGSVQMDFVGLAYNAAGNVCIILGPSKMWSYPKLQVTSALVGHTNPPDSYRTGWNIDVPTSIDNLHYQNTTDGAVLTGAYQVTYGNDTIKEINKNLSDLADIASDSKLTPVEKQIVNKDKLDIDGTYSLLIAQAKTVALDVTNINNVYTAYTAAYSALSSYINPYLTASAITQTGSITRSEFNGKFTDYYTAEQNLRNAITNNLNTGGTNLLINSGNFSDNHGWSSYTGITSITVGTSSSIKDNRGNFINYLQINSASGDGTARIRNAALIPYAVGKTYVVTLISGVSMTGVAVGGKIYSTSGEVGSFSATMVSQENYQGVSNWFKSVWIYTTTAVSGAVNFFFYVYVGTATTFYIGYMKAEEGTRPSAWSPAPEDIQAQVDTIVNDDVITKNEKVTLIPAILSIQKQYAQDLAFYNTLAGIDSTYPGMITNWAQYKAAAIKFNAAPYTTIVASPTVDTTLTTGQGATIKSDFSSYFQYYDVVQGKLNDVQTLIANKFTSDSIGDIQVGGANLIISKNLIWRFNNGQITYADHTFKIVSIGTDIAGFKIKVDPNTDYIATFQATNPATKVRLFQYTTEPMTWDSPTSAIASSEVSGVSGVKITTVATAQWIMFGYYNATAYGFAAGDTVTNMQFEKGNKSTQFKLSDQDVQDDIIIGTTNLIHRGDDLVVATTGSGLTTTKDEDTKIITVGGTWASNYITFAAQNIIDVDQVQIGDYVTISIYCKGSADASPAMYLAYSSGGTGYVTALEKTDPNIWKWISIVIPITKTLNPIASSLHLGVVAYNTATTPAFQFQKIMINRGNRPLSTWTPNLGDLVSDIANIQIGGSNLLNNSSFISAKGGWSNNLGGFTYDTTTFPGITCALITSDAGVSGHGAFATLAGLTSGKQYVFSFDIYFSTSVPYPTGTGNILSIGIENPGTRWGTASDLSHYAPLRGQWYRVSLPFTANIASTHFLVYTGTNTGANRFWVTNIMVEEGNKPSTWRPSQQDINDQLDSLTSKLGQFGDDSIFLPSEKKVIAAEWLSIYNEYSSTLASANNAPYDVINLTTQKTNYTNAFNALASYLFPYIGSSAANSNLDTAKMQATSTGVNSGTYRTTLGTYYNTKAALLNAMAGGVGGLIDNIEVGGANLQSNLPNNWIVGMRSRADGTINSTTVTTRMTPQYALIVKPNTWYCITVYNLSGTATPPKLDGVIEYNSGSTFVKVTGATGATQVILQTASNTGKLTVNVYYGSTSMTTNQVGVDFGVKIEQGNKPTDWSISDDDKATNNGGMAIRYIRDYINGSTMNTTNHWVEIQAIAGTVNRALNCSTSGSTTLTSGQVITDGDTQSVSGHYAVTPNDSGTTYVTVDLGKVYYDIDEIKVWHYYADSRMYHNSKTAISPDGTNWYTVFDSAVSGEYMETKNGNSIPISPNKIQEALNKDKYRKQNLLSWDKVYPAVPDVDSNGEFVTAGVAAYSQFASKYASRTYAIDQIINDIGPFGVKTNIWRAYCRADFANQCGGFMGAKVFDNTIIDVTKLYRVSVYVKVHNYVSAGINYFGFYGSFTTSSGAAGTPNNNQYACIRTRTSSDVGRWMLFIGYILPQGATTDQMTTAEFAAQAYYCDDGTKVSITSPTVTAAWAAGIDASYTGNIALRMMQYNCDTGDETWYTLPRFEVCDGNELTIQQLLNKDTYALEQLSITNGIVADFSDDNKLTPPEKQTLIKLLQQFTYEHGDIEASCTQFSITNTVNSTYTALYNYLNPLLNSLTTTSNISGSNLRNLWNAYTNEKTRVIPLINAAIKAQSDQYTDDAVNNIQIGGTNLYLQSSFENGTWGNVGTGTVVDASTTETSARNGTKVLKEVPGATYAGRDVPCDPSTNYTISAWVYLSTDFAFSGATQFVRLSLEHGASGVVYADLSLKGKWQRISLTRMSSSSAADIRVLMYHTGATWTAGYVLWDCLQVEVGTKATDWSPAPQDIQDQVDTIASDDIITPAEATILRPSILAIQKEYAQSLAFYNALPSYLKVTTGLIYTAGWNTYVTYASKFNTTPYTSIVAQTTGNVTVNGDTIKTDFANFYGATRDAVLGAINSLTQILSSVYIDGGVGTSDGMRQANSLPTYYRGKGLGTYREFKQSSSIGISGPTVGTYCNLDTVVGYQSTSGGPVIQNVNVGGSIFTRYSNSTDSTWNAWTVTANTDDIDDLNDDITTLTTNLTDLNNDFDTFAEDNNITAAEAVAIGKYLKQIAATYADLHQRYVTIKANADAVSVPTTDLNTKWVAFNNAYQSSSTGLIAAINACVSAGANMTTTQKNLVDSRFDTFNAAIDTFTAEAENVAAATWKAQSGSDVQQSNIKVISSNSSPAKLFTFPQKSDGTPASYTNGTITGAYLISTPITSSAYMCSICIKGYAYVGGTSEINVVVNCYNYTSTQIASTSYTNYGQWQFDTIKVAKDSAGRLLIILGAYNKSTPYPKLWVEWAQIGHTNPPDSYLKGWSIGVITADPSGATVITEITGTVIQNEFANLVGNNGSSFIVNGQAGTTVANSGILTGALAVGNTQNGNNAGLNGLGTSTTEVRIWAGASYSQRANAVFRVLDDGSLFASSADITGKITASTGAIGGWQIGGASLYNDTAKVGLISSGTGTTTRPVIYAGSTLANRGTAPFRVYYDGSIVATTGVIGSWTIGNGGLYSDTVQAGFLAATGSGAQTVLYTGSTFANRNTAIFRVMSDGSLYAEKGVIAGFTIASNSLSNTTPGNGVSISISGKTFSGQANNTASSFNGDGVSANGSRKPWDFYSYNQSSILGFLRDGEQDMLFVGSSYILGLESATAGINQAGWPFTGMSNGGHAVNFGGLFTSTQVGGLHLGTLFIDRINNYITSSWNGYVRGFESFSATSYSMVDGRDSGDFSAIFIQGNVNFTLYLPSYPFIGRTVFVKQVDGWGNSYNVTVSGSSTYPIRQYNNTNSTTATLRSSFGFQNSDSGNWSNSALFIFDGYLWNMERQYNPAGGI